ncbi:BnaAnng24340D [Brassica napus]|uniref:BnaAnng24340D protein n=1 Tax=Brassica napus TaxID=3708 RepID=A0A078JL10_BRANA|nr:BnaAnng24340D [Brassica napus]
MEESKAPHVAILPSPGMGHLIPLAQSTVKISKNCTKLSPVVHLLRLSPSRRPHRPSTHHSHRNSYLPHRESFEPGAPASL